MNTLKNFLLLAVILIEIIFSSSDFWVFTHFSPIIITTCYFLLIKKENNALILLLIGTFAIDILNGRNVGLVSFSFLMSLLIVEVISRQIAIIDNQSKTVRSILTVAIYIMIYFGQMTARNLLDFKQLVTLAIIYLITYFSIITLFKTFNKSKRNVIRI